MTIDPRDLDPTPTIDPDFDADPGFDPEDGIIMVDLDPAILHNILYSIFQE